MAEAILIQCTRCGKTKAADFFYRQANRKNGLRAHCIPCDKLARDVNYAKSKTLQCSVAGCKRGRYVHGLCAMHASRVRNTGELGPVLSLGELNRGKCQVIGCTNAARSRQLCQTHYNRLRKYGSPRGVSERTITAIRGRVDGKVDYHGYRIVYCPGHPSATLRNGLWAFEHRKVMADYLGRPLRENENIHHVNGRKADNRIQNLELWVSSQPSGQRVQDLVEWSREIEAQYGDEYDKHPKLSNGKAKTKDAA